MDSDQIPLEDLICNFDPDTFITSDSNTSMPLKQGMKSLSEDPMTTCSFTGDSPFMPSEQVVESSSVLQHNIPCTTEMAGNHDFQINLGTQSKRVANPDWIFKNEKLYIKPSILCPIMISASASLPLSCNLKIMPIFKNQAHIREVVRCCPNHTVMEANTNGFSCAAHFIRCDNEKVVYKECPLTGRYYLTVPFVPSQQDPATKMLSTHELFSFVCNNSCGGLNRRAIQVIFELTQGETVLGRRLIEVRVCACPGRDSKSDETHRQPYGRKRRLHSIEEQVNMHMKEQRYQTPADGKVAEEFNNPSKKKKVSGENYYLKINGRQNFVIMERIAKALELFTSMEKRFFSRNFPFQALEQITRRSHNEYSQYAEPDSTLFRQTSCHENSTFNERTPSLSPNGMTNWKDSTHQHSVPQETPSSSQNVSMSYSTDTVRRTRMVN